MLNGVTPFLQIFFAVSGAGGGTVMVMVLTQLMGLYAISSIVLIRKQLPVKYRYACPAVSRLAEILFCCIFTLYGRTLYNPSGCTPNSSPALSLNLLILDQGDRGKRRSTGLE